MHSFALTPTLHTTAISNIPSGGGGRTCLWRHVYSSRPSGSWIGCSWKLWVIISRLLTALLIIHCLLASGSWALFLWGILSVTDIRLAYNIWQPQLLLHTSLKSGHVRDPWHQQQTSGNRDMGTGEKTQQFSPWELPGGKWALAHLPSWRYLTSLCPWPGSYHGCQWAMTPVLPAQLCACSGDVPTLKTLWKQPVYHHTSWNTQIYASGGDYAVPPVWGC